MSVVFRSVCPVLPARDLGALVRFYQQLRFEQQYRDDGYAILQRNTVALHLSHVPSHTPEQAIACVIYLTEVGDGFDELYAECQALGVVHANGALRAMPYGRQFVVVDPENNIMTLVLPPITVA
jgi:predicted enzyme related to lactoylglutathione lyase